MHFKFQVFRTNKKNDLIEIFKSKIIILRKTRFKLKLVFYFYLVDLFLFLCVYHCITVYFHYILVYNTTHHYFMTFQKNPLKIRILDLRGLKLHKNATKTTKI